MMLDILQPENDAGSIWLAAASTAHCEKLTVYSEIRVSYFSRGEELVQLGKPESTAGV